MRAPPILSQVFNMRSHHTCFARRSFYYEHVRTHITNLISRPHSSIYLDHTLTFTTTTTTTTATTTATRYKMGEARLAEVMEGMCSKSDDKCNAMMEDIEEPLEEWWAAKDRNQQDSDIKGLEEHLCIVTMKLCCLPGHYGPKCSKCPKTKVCWLG